MKSPIDLEKTIAFAKNAVEVYPGRNPRVSVQAQDVLTMAETIKELVGALDMLRLAYKHNRTDMNPEGLIEVTLASVRTKIKVTGIPGLLAAKKAIEALGEDMEA